MGKHESLESDLEGSLDHSAAMVIFGEGNHPVRHRPVAADAVEHPLLLSSAGLLQHLLDNVVAKSVLHEDQNVLLDLVDDARHLQGQQNQNFECNKCHGHKM